MRRPALIVFCACAAGATAFASSGSAPAPNRDALAGPLDESGLQIVYRQAHPREDGLTVIGGVARGRAGGRVGFEFVIDEDGEASTSQLGTIGFPVELPNRTRFVHPIIRGVLRNVAYANYFLGRGSGDREDMLVVHRLDDALLGAFPPDDAQVHPILHDAPE